MKSEVLLREAKDAGFFLAAVTGNRFHLENCRSVLAVGLVYGNDVDGDGDDSQPETPAKIAPFARRNYYRAAAQKLRDIARKLRGEYGGNKADYRIYCNSSAADDKKIAIESGLANIGRNSLLLTKEYGSLFITGILALPFDCDAEGRGNPAGRSPFALCKGCGHHPPCKAACPTGAVTGEYRIQKERCIQWYLSGHEDAIPDIVKTHWDNRLYGCTLCQDACVYHKKTVRGVGCAIGILPAVMDAQRIADASGAEVKQMFHGTALGLSWLCPDGLKRNAAICVESASRPLGGFPWERRNMNARRYPPSGE
jgi:epoxyqueuosine reductase